MSKKLYVGNLPYSATEDELKEMFGKVGEVLSAKVITDAGTGRSKGFGFVEMSSDDDADKAISTLNGATLLDRTLTVNEAKPQRERGSGGFGGGRGGGGGGRGFGGGGGGGGRNRNSSWR